jgi:hypothetical protein
LILGAPGSGKTTLLLELARDLIARAEADPTYPIPVVFHLASWARQRHPLADWLVDELNERYDVPRPTGRAWVETDQILPLLDGLDEVPAEHRLACAAAINAFRREHGLGPLAVCSRRAEYEVLATRLKLRGAVRIQPLSPQQVEAYLASAGDHLAGLRAALEADADLRELATSPLLLSIMTLAYQGKGAEALPASGTAEDRRAHLFATYVDQMLGRRGAGTRYTRAQTTRWLTWLARGMAQQGQAIFLLERLQPDWLPTRAARWQYVLVDRLGGGLCLGLAVGLAFGLAFGLVFGLTYGGYACQAHFALRLVLWRSGAIPWDYTRFLDYAADRIFLYKVGGGYVFVHRMLQEYFTALDVH